jgi:ATP-dependent Clp protease, protease subunit
VNFKNINEDFAEHRMLKLLGDVTVEKQEILCTAIELLSLKSSDPITLIIDSVGGDAFPARHLSDAIMFSRAPVHGLVTVTARSAALSILQACDKRLAYPEASFLLHFGRGNISFDDKQSPQDQFMELSTQKERMLQFVIRRAGVGKGDELRALCGENRVINASQALKFGLIDEILTPPKKG